MQNRSPRLNVDVKNYKPLENCDWLERGKKAVAQSSGGEKGGEKEILKEHGFKLTACMKTLKK